MREKLILLIMLIPIFFLHTVTLEESIKIAKQNNQELLAEKSGLEAVGWSKKNAFTNFLPKVSFNSSLVRIDAETYDELASVNKIPIFNASGIPTGDYIPFSAAALSGGYYKTTYTNDITVQLPVFNGGKEILGYQLAGLAKQQAEKALIGKEKDLDYAVASTYMGLLKLQDLKILSEKSLNSTLSHLNSVQKKYDVGTAKYSDVLQWQVNKMNNQTSIHEIDNSINELKGYWKNLLGAEGNELPDEIDIGSFDNEINNLAALNSDEILQKIVVFLEEVKRTSVTIQNLNLVNRMMEKNYKMAVGNFLPALNLQYTYQIESDDKWNLQGEDNWNLAAVFSVPIFQSGANFTNLKKVKYEQKKTAYETAWIRENYLVAAENAMRKLITKARIVITNQTALELAEENHQIINDLFEQDMVTNTELLDAEIMLFSNEMNLVSSYYDFILTKYEIKKYTQQED
jgi:outer membrane protein